MKKTDTGAQSFRRPTRVTDQEVTVVIPCFNAADFVRQAIESVQAQTYPNWNLIVVDDGSTDSTLEIVCEIGAAASFNITILSGPNRGASNARNRAIKLATSQYVAFLDADDYWHPDKLSQQLAFLSQNPTAVGVTGGYRMWDVETGGVSVDLDFLWSKGEMRNWTLLGRRAPALNSLLMVDREVILDIGGYDEQLISFSEDVDLAWRLLSKGPLLSTSTVLATIRLSAGQTHRNYVGMVFGLRKIYDKISLNDPGLAKLGVASVEIYTAVCLFRSGQYSTAIQSFVRSFLSAPIGSMRFIFRRIKDIRRVNLRTHTGHFPDVGKTLS